MKKWINNSKKGMAVFGAVAFMLVAGWQFGVGSTEAPFSENEIALEKAIAGSNEYGGVCCWWFDSCPHPIGLNFADSVWVPNHNYC